MEGLKALANMVATTNEQITNAAAVTVPPPAIPYAVGTRIKRLRVKTLLFFREEYPCSCWCPATIIAYNATTSRYTIEYEGLSLQKTAYKRKKVMKTEHEDLEHNEINTEPFPLEPRYPCGMKLEQYRVWKKVKKKEDLFVYVVGDIVARFLYIPSDNDRLRFAPEEPTWMYSVTYRPVEGYGDVQANAEDLHEDIIDDILKRMHDRRQEAYAVGTQVKKLQVKGCIGSGFTHSYWCPATIISYNATTNRYIIEYEEGQHAELEHTDINTEPFPFEPRYPCGMKLEQYGIAKEVGPGKKGKFFDCLMGKIVARVLYIPRGDRINYAINQTWMYRVKYRETMANAEDLCELQIQNILEQMQQRKQEEEEAKSQAWKSITDSTEGTNKDEDVVLREYFAQHQISPEDIATSIHVLQVVAKLAATKSSASSNNGTENSKKRNRPHNNTSNNSTSNTNDVDADADVLENTKTDSALSEVLDLYRTSKTMRPLRKALTDCYQKVVAPHMYNGLGNNTKFRQHKEDAHLSLTKRRKLAETTMQQKYLATTQLRQGRIEKLNAKLEEGQTEEQRKLAARMMIPDGPVETTNIPTLPRIANGSSAASSALPDATIVLDKDDDDTKEVADPPNEGIPNIELPKLRSCYVCKQRFRDLHVFYDQLCPPCATLNYTKRLEQRDLTGYTAVVTGARVKIGYHTCLKLLRAGCTVIATTRFPNSAVAAYRTAPDFATWQSRLSIYGLDLRDVTGIELFCRYLAQKLVAGPNKNGTGNGLDILINNACQTIRRPTAYYRPQVEQEQALWRESDATHKAILRDCRDYEGFRRQLHDTTTTETQSAIMSSSLGAVGLSAGAPVPRLEASVGGGAATSSVLTSSSAATASTDAALVTASSKSTPFERTGMSHSAAASQMVLCPDDVGVDAAVLPPGLSDVNQQQLDLRTTNSWLLNLGQVSTPEVMECMFVNAIAPFLLNSKLQPLMIHRGTGSGKNNDDDDNTKDTSTTADTDTAAPTRNRYIVNVSAMEGKFYRYKMSHHPHTNMAKAALNMMTRTSSEHLAKQHAIYMNSIDTGWINDENPLERASKTAKVNNFQTPIDEIDAAARILDPIMTNAQLYGKFLKDYRETEW